MIKNSLSHLFFISASSLLFSQVGINTDTPNSNSLLHVSEQLGTQPKTYKGILTPRFTTAERDAHFSPSNLENGLLIYNTTQGCFNYWRETVPSYTENNGIWISMCDFGTTPGYVQCNPSSPTAIVDLVSPTTGRIWMDRNLGATQAATSSTDADSYGDLFQWGRAADGHQCRASDSYTGPVSNFSNSIANPWYGKFVKLIRLDEAVNNHDWLITHEANLWQGVNGTNNPCPNGYRIPTQTEWRAELITDTDVAFSTLKLSLAGYRNFGNENTGLPAEFEEVNTWGFYWSSTQGVPSTETIHTTIVQDFNNNYQFNNTTTMSRSFGVSVRCIKN